MAYFGCGTGSNRLRWVLVVLAVVLYLVFSILSNLELMKCDYCDDDDNCQKLVQNGVLTADATGENGMLDIDGKRYHAVHCVLLLSWLVGSSVRNCRQLFKRSHMCQNHAFAEGGLTWCTVLSFSCNGRQTTHGGLQESKNATFYMARLVV